MSEPYDVALVGYGPVGALLANLLGREGVRVVVLERDREVYKLPRAVHFDHEVMRIFQSVGLADAVIEPHTAPILGYEFVNGQGELLFRVPMPDTDAQTHQGWKPDYMFHQPSLEQALRDGAESREGIDVLLGHEVLDVDERPDGVRVHARSDTGEERWLEARYVVGCDGAGSGVRRQAGLELEDLAFDEPWLVVDATVEVPPTELGLPHCPTQRCDPARPVTYVPVAGPYIRWEFMLLPGESREQMLRPERIDALIAKWTDPGQVHVIRAAVYRFHAVLAREWRRGRLLLAGDAAHQTPPFLGQGMCAGMRDAANLAFKLALVLRGHAREGLLDSYGQERSPHVRTLIEVAIALGRVICILDPAGAAARDADFMGRPEREVAAPTPRLGEGFFQAGSKLGGSLGLQAQVKSADGREGLLDDILGAGFALLQRGPAAAQLDARATEIAQRLDVRVAAIGGDGGALEDPTGAYARWFDDSACDAILVRPDHQVFGDAAGAKAASALLEELDRALGS